MLPSLPLLRSPASDFGHGRQPPTAWALAHIAVGFIASHDVFNKPKPYVIPVVPYTNGGETSRVSSLQEIFYQGTSPSGMANPMALCATPRRFGPTFSVTTSAAGRSWAMSCCAAVWAAAASVGKAWKATPRGPGGRPRGLGGGVTPDSRHRPVQAPQWRSHR